MDKVQLAIRRSEAYARIDKAVRALAAARGIEVGPQLDQRHRDPDIEHLLRIEALADSLDTIAVPQDKPTDKAEAVAQVEQELEAETGSDFAQTSSEPPTLAETDKPATSGVPKGKVK